MWHQRRRRVSATCHGDWLRAGQREGRRRGKPSTPSCGPRPTSFPCVPHGPGATRTGALSVMTPHFHVLCHVHYQPLPPAPHEAVWGRLSPGRWSTDGERRAGGPHGGESALRAPRNPPHTEGRLESRLESASRCRGTERDVRAQLDVLGSVVSRRRVFRRKAQRRLRCIP